ncbi:TRADD-N-associated membrane domain-containing protein [Micromonospora saelicesensis]|uniref:Cyanobacterial TRADD-N associated 2 transmembrane domain-containing protein n=1 Tax=Micromonospora saelicesensis TaxID=285676 RepID=A0ABX9CC60_9ACTN|nr:hypothetical protein [Micromonospora saelicesensis]RAN93867.1 hypothetical protein GAR05_05167 [Micromonospora saelicesensis]
MFPFASDMVTTLVEFFRAKNAARKPATIVSLLVAVGAGFYIATILFLKKTDPSYVIPGAFLGAAAVIVLFAVSASYVEPKRLPSAAQRIGAEDTLAHILEERAKIEEQIRESKGGDIYSNLELNLNHLSEYYTINKSQARSSFRIGASAVILGFIAVLAGVALLYTDKNAASTSVPVIATVAGLLGQFIGAYCFYLYNRAAQHVTTFYGRLSQVQDTMIAINLCDAIEEKQRKSMLIEQIIAALLSRAGHTSNIGVTPEDATNNANRSRRRRRPKTDRAAAGEPSAQAPRS